ncbi:MAG: adenylate/guanylate cyclase domain-containing protein, partial [Proteobacteria bacterium]
RTREAQPIFTRFGMHAGWLERGVIGGGGRFSYNVVGDIVNTAKRIESLNKTLGTQILATREVVEGLDEFLLRPVGRFRVKGKHQPVEVAEIVCRRLEANGQQVALCQTFEAVVNAFRVNDHQSVREELERIRNISSADGPADFYLKLVDGTHRDLVVDRFGTILLDGTGRAPIPRYGNSD